MLTPDTASEHITGPASAKAGIIEYGDFQCPLRVQAHAALNYGLPFSGAQRECHVALHPRLLY
ncbi:hypothetical protein TPL01_25800 [Sulfuriferula plumbiphila]|uniref:Thioredoxin-like fold domain-containing protein n=1 Tax=Sulfuriferula plumbiphila TaxID=171865 RepID=A0A512LAF9_9PROT|nr:hypothetical protein SFPGR_24130 [Sulfuriferula plumbiphila]GEP31442.1 hypothetical protein TPL01_25800 [Sulfuriferula plumbiphila]